MGEQNVHDEERSGQPSIASDNLVQSVDQKNCERRRFTISELSCASPKFHAVFSTRLSQVKLSQVLRNMVSESATGAHKTQRMASTLTFLERYPKDGDEFCNHIARVTYNETRVSFVNAEIKEQWMHTHSPNKPKKFKQTTVCQNAVLWGRKKSADGGIHATGDHNNVTSVLQNIKKLRRAIQNKRCGMLTHGVVLHDNERPHTTARTPILLEHFNWELFDHPPYSPDLSPSDNHLFTSLKNWLGSQCFSNNEGLMKGVKTWLSS
jgi:histone-lysine N-methyltransferase SETMAR